MIAGLLRYIGIGLSLALAALGLGIGNGIASSGGLQAVERQDLSGRAVFRVRPVPASDDARADPLRRNCGARGDRGAPAASTEARAALGRGGGGSDRGGDIELAGGAHRGRAVGGRVDGRQHPGRRG